MPTRRNFLKNASLVALAPTVPAVLARAARAAAPQTDGRILVVIQLDGGNDGINTVVPFADEGYAKHRDKLRLADDRLLKITNELGLHPSLASAADLFQQQRLAIVQGVGYPDPNRSHDVSMSIWHTARLGREDHTGYGWIGRALDDSAPRSGSPHCMLIGEGATPRALWGRRSIASSLHALDDLAPQLDLMPSLGSEARGGSELRQFLRRNTLDAYTTADVLQDVAIATSTDALYPATPLCGRLKLVARLIKADLGTRVYYAVQPGYDTHSTQMPVHSRLLRELADGLKAFLDDLRSAELEERVLVMCFSEFGRRVTENGSAGTDHGTAGPVLLAGGSVRGGIHGETPRLSELENGDLEYTMDFRSVYSAVLADWLGISPSVALDSQLETLNIIRA